MNTTTNPLLEQVLSDRNGHYCHALEVSDTYELESIIESVIECYEGYTEAQYIDFFESMELYSLDDSNEESIYSFSFTDYIKDTI